MWVHPSSGVVLPGEKETIHFSVQVDDNSAGVLNTGEEKLEGEFIFQSLLGLERRERWVLMTSRFAFPQMF